MRSDATRSLFPNRLTGVLSLLGALILLVLGTSQVALAQNAKMVLDEYQRLETAVRVAEDIYEANPSPQAKELVSQAHAVFEQFRGANRSMLQAQALDDGAVRTLATGGPDGFGYTYLDSNEPDGPTLSFTSIATGGNDLGLGDDDGATVPIGFTFPFYGTAYTDMPVASNGYLNPTGNDVTDFTNDCPIVTGTDPDGTIAPYWDDWRPPVGGSVHAESFGACPTGSLGGACFVAEWNNVPHWDNGGSNTFQAILYPTGIIEYQYDALTEAGNSPTVGIENQAGNDGLTYACTGGPPGPFGAPLAVAFIPPTDHFITKAVNNNAPEIGEVVTFTITVQRVGAIPSAIRVKDVLPDGLDFVGSTVSQGSYNPVSGQWNVGEIGSAATLTIDAEVTSAASITNTAEITFSSVPDTDPGNNAASVTLNPVAADLSVRKQVTAFRTEGGTAFATFEVTVRNSGPNDVCGVEVTDTGSPAMTLVGLTVSQGLPDVPSITPPIIVWDAGCLDVGDRATMTVRVEAPDQEGVSLANAAEVTDADLPDPDSEPGDQEGDDFAVAIAGFRANPDFVEGAGPGGIIRRDPLRFFSDLQLTKVADVESAGVGDAVTWTITVTNQGPQNNAGIEVKEYVPDCVTVDSVTPSEGTSFDADDATWDVGKLRVDGSATLTLVTTLGADCTGEVTNRAAVESANLPDPDGFFNLFDDDPEPDEEDTATVTVESASAAKAERGVRLLANYPNPFNPETVIPFELQEATRVSLVVYDLLGRQVQVLVDGRVSAGVHEAVFRAEALPTGLYLVRLEAAGVVQTQRITLMK